MSFPYTILLAADYSLIGSLFHELLRTHGYHVLLERCGLTPVVIGHSYPDRIDLLVADVDHGGQGRGPRLAENLGKLRPSLQTLFFTQESRQLRLLRNPGALDESIVPFTPGKFLELIGGILSEGFPAPTPEALRSAR